MNTQEVINSSRNPLYKLFTPRLGERESLGRDKTDEERQRKKILGSFSRNQSKIHIAKQIKHHQVHLRTKEARLITVSR